MGKVVAERNEVGEKLKRLRESQGLTPVELAQKSGCVLELIEKIEAGELIPTLTPLFKIARALDVRLGTLLDDAEAIGPAICRAGKHKEVIHFSGEQSSVDKPQLDFFSLAQNKADRHMEPFLISVHPLADAAHKLSSHEGEEFMYVLKGELEIFYGEEKYQLKTGDSIYLDSVVPHHVHSAPGVETEILAMVYEPY
jgi:transcriptional regulator with XRE-family HTH domain